MMTMLTIPERQALLAELESMPSSLEQWFGGLAGDAAMRRGPGESFSPVEHCWHMADLEAEGYAVRISRLLREEAPHLADFDGDTIAEARQYRLKSLHEGLRAFRAARQANVALLRSVPEAAWSRSGTQEGVGALTLADVPRMMRAHDASHEAEILG